MAQTEPNLDHDISWFLLPSCWAKTVVALISFLCFANSYDGDFVFDDSEAIINNKVCLFFCCWFFLFSFFFPFDLSVNRKEIVATVCLRRPIIFILVENFLLIFLFLSFIFLEFGVLVVFFVVLFCSKLSLSLTGKLCSSALQKN